MKELRIPSGFIAVLLLALVSCTPTPPPLPTLASIPTSTITLTPSSTFTFTPSSTFTASPTLTLTPSITLTPSVTDTATDIPTQTPTDTFTPTDTVTPTDTFTPTNTVTPTDTRTPTDTPTATIVPTIHSLTADPPTIQSGGQVVVRWDTDSTGATLDLLSQGNALIESAQVPATGTRTYTPTSANGNMLFFRLTVIKGGHSAVQTVSITVTCASPWAITPAPAGCPQSAAQQASFTYQSFQNGIAFYVPSNNQVYFMISNGAAVTAYTNTWNSSIIEPTRTPPSGLMDPNGPIGYVWHHQPWSDGNTLQAVVGWANGASQNYTGTLQVGPNAELYITAPTGATYRLNINGSTGTWQKVG